MERLHLCIEYIVKKQNNKYIYNGTGAYKNICPKNVSISVSTILGIFCFLFTCKNIDYI
jgi:hypothetical protein